MNNTHTWETVWNEIINSETIKEEYKKAFILNVFQKICAKMHKDEGYKNHILKLFRQTFSKEDTVRNIVIKEFNYDLSDEETDLLCQLFEAYRKKQNKRKTIPQNVKEKLFKEQKGVCQICGQELGTDWRKIHVDHIVPWVLVGDELDNNYQLLCETCNECKSSKTDYVFKQLIKLG